MSFVKCPPLVVAKVGLLLALLVGGSSRARAQDADPEALFRDAKRDLESGKVDLACSKFAASYEQSGVAGALLSWADCEERRGHLRLSQELFAKGVIAVAGDTERRDFARDRAAAIGLRLAKVKLDVAGDVASLTIDGEKVSLLDPPPLDPGEHVIVATWGAGERHELSVSLSEGEVKQVRLAPPPRPAPKPPVEARPEPSPMRERLRAAGWIVGGVGATAGLVFGGTAVAVAVECPDRRCESGMEGVLIANAATGALGAAGLLAGAVLLGLGYAEGGSLSVGADAGPDRAGVVGRLRF